MSSGPINNAGRTIIYRDAFDGELNGVACEPAIRRQAAFRVAYDATASKGNRLPGVACLQKINDAIIKQAVESADALVQRSVDGKNGPQSADKSLLSVSRVVEYCAPLGPVRDDARLAGVEVAQWQIGKRNVTVHVSGDGEIGPYIDARENVQGNALLALLVGIDLRDLLSVMDGETKVHAEELLKRVAETLKQQNARDPVTAARPASVHAARRSVVRVNLGTGSAMDTPVSAATSQQQQQQQSRKSRKVAPSAAMDVPTAGRGQTRRGGKAGAGDAATGAMPDNQYLADRERRLQAANANLGRFKEMLTSAKDAAEQERLRNTVSASEQDIKNLQAEIENWNTAQTILREARRFRVMNQPVPETDAVYWATDAWQLTDADTLNEKIRARAEKLLRESRHGKIEERASTVVSWLSDVLFDVFERQRSGRAEEERPAAMASSTATDAQRQQPPKPLSQDATDDDEPAAAEPEHPWYKPRAATVYVPQFIIVGMPRTAAVVPRVASFLTLGFVDGAPVNVRGDGDAFQLGVIGDPRVTFGQRGYEMNMPLSFTKRFVDYTPQQLYAAFCERRRQQLDTANKHLAISNAFVNLNMNNARPCLWRVPPMPTR